MTDTHYNTPLSRASLERAIEDLIGLLDFFDGDPDLEPVGDEEPSLGWSNPNTGLLPECEADWRAAEQDPGMDQGHLHTQIYDGETEPNLGWTEGFGQGLYRLGSLTDREEQCEDEGAQCEDEGADPGTWPPDGYVGFNPMNGQPIVEDRS